MTHVAFTPEKLKSLKVAYQAAQAAGADSFMFEGVEILVSYARYVIEHLENVYDQRKKD